MDKTDKKIIKFMKQIGTPVPTSEIIPIIQLSWGRMNSHLNWLRLNGFITRKVIKNIFYWELVKR